MPPRFPLRSPTRVDAVRASGRALRLSACVALVALAAACASTQTLTTFDLTAPRERISGGTIQGQVVVSVPASIALYASDRIIVKDAAGSVSLLPGGQWADQLPNLLQARIVEAFENASKIKAVTRPGEGVQADYALNTAIRLFQINAGTGEAVVELSAKLVSGQGGRVVAARIFTARVPVAQVAAAEAARGLDQALGTVLRDMVRWLGTTEA